MIKILIADDQFLILEAIKTILEHESEINIVGTAQDGQTAIAQAKKLRPDILLIDIEMPKMNGILATKYVRKYLPETKVIVLTSHKCQDYLAQALLAGASGYLLKDSLIKDLKQEIYSFGRGYSRTKAKLLTQTVKKNSAANVVRYQEKIVYLKKYRKNIYKPGINQRKQQRYFKLAWRSQKTTCIKPDNSGITKASLTPTFNPTVKEIKETNSKTSSPPNVCSPPGFNRRKYFKRIIWLLLAISSFILSIVIF